MPLQLSEVRYIYDLAGRHKLDIVTVPCPVPGSEYGHTYNFRGYDFSKDRLTVAAWFVREGAEKERGARRPNKGVPGGENRAYEAGLHKARSEGADAEREYRISAKAKYVTHDVRKGKGKGKGGVSKGLSATN